MDKIGYSFNQPHLLETALTHRSKSSRNNERLEFLGDALLGFAVTAQLFRQFPQAQEGELSRLRAKLVNESSLAELGQKFDLSSYLKLGPGELKTGGARRLSILADTIEALIGAIYLDADILICEKIILKWFEDRLASLDSTDAVKDAKSRLQEYLQHHQLPLPHYAITGITGESPDQRFHVTCEVEGYPHYCSHGTGGSRRAAEQMAAEIFLSYLKRH